MVVKTLDINSYWSVFSWYDFILKILGFHSAEKYHSMFKTILIFYVSNIFLMNCEMYYGSCDSTQPLINRLVNGFTAIGVSGFAIPIYSLWKDRSLYRQSLEWCYSCLKVSPNGFKDISCSKYNECFYISTKLFKVVVILSYFSTYFVNFIPSVTNLICNKMELMPAVHLPYLNPNSTFKFLLNLLHTHLSGHFFSLTIGLIFATSLTSTNFCIYSLKIIGEILQKVDKHLSNTKDRKDYFVKSIKIVVDLHNEIIEQERMMKKLTSKLILSFELSVYNAVLLGWCVMLVDKTAIIVSIGCSCFVVEHFFICYANERILDAHDQLFIDLYGLAWHEWKPKERKALLFLMMMVDRPNVYTAGHLHNMNFDNFAILIKRGYSIGILLNDLF